MKNRFRQRENRRLKPRSYEKPWQNPEGYNDFTAYIAIRNITRMEKAREKQDPRGVKQFPDRSRDTAG